MAPSSRTRYSASSAEVWKAKILGPAGFQRTVVVKRILPHLAEDPHFVQMFVAEARLSARAAWF